MKKTLLLFLISAFFLFNFGCKKYPDGPAFSLQSKKNRVCGYWDVEYFAIDGYDSTQYLKSNPRYSRYSFEDDHGYWNFFCQSTGEGNWGFTNFKKDLHIYDLPENTIPVLGPYGMNCTWHIRRLTETELWLTKNYEGREFFLKFKQ